jgi:hypothetical protein
MEAATAPAPADKAQDSQPQPAATQPRKRLFEWSQWVHVGQGADECEHRTDGACKDEDHFHAWVRLPNPYQRKDILEKARAARARRMRTLRDPDSDARAIIEDDLDAIRASDAKDILVDEMMNAQFQEILVDATREVMDYDATGVEAKDSEGGEDGDEPKKYALIGQDIEELNRLESLPEEERGEDYLTLKKRVDEYRADVRRVQEQISGQRRETLVSKSWDDLIEMVRQERMENSSAEAFLEANQLWQMFACTYKAPKVEQRVFRDFTSMKLNTPDEVLDTLVMTFNDLESRLSRGAAGNS